MYKEAAETYALDEEMAKKLAASNPEAFRNIIKRMLEASGRGYWQADAEVRHTHCLSSSYPAPHVAHVRIS